MLWTAFLLGFLSSFHCAGMCGPIALALVAKGKKAFFVHKLLYNLGRSTTYALLGLVVGSLGFSLSLVGVQRGFSVGAGVVILIVALLYKKSDRLLYISFNSEAVNWLKIRLHGFLKKGGSYGFFATGLINGLLPCGMVYLALAAALGLQHIFLGALYMFCFGLGTLPLLFVMMYSGKLIPASVRHRFQRAIPYLGIVIGFIFIFKGLGLGIYGTDAEIKVFDYVGQQIGITMCR